METYFTDEVYNKLEIMYEGDKARDASAKIRGFLFQDLVAIEFLLEEQVQHVFLEFLEDIDVAYEDGRFKIIQVKYYPKKNPDMKEIITDLYYQYLRFDLLNSDNAETIKIKPYLIVHRDKAVDKPDLAKIKEYIGEVLPNRPDSLKDIGIQLREKIPSMKKEEQKQKVFSSWAYEKSLSDFLNDFEIISKNNIRQLQDTIEIKLEEFFSIDDVSGMQDHLRKILMGLAVIFIQERYKAEEVGVNNIRISKADFEDYIRSQMEMCSDKFIIAYITTVVTEEYEAVITENDCLSVEQRNSLDIIYKNTVEWISEECSKIDGQFRIVNTLSTDTLEQVSKFWERNVSERLLVIAGCKENMKFFLRYLWKIIFDIYSEYVVVSHAIKNGELLKPQKYIVKSETKYICLHFPQDCVETSVILPPAYGIFNSRKKNHWLRLMEERPRKWFMKCDSNLAGKHEYAYSTANIVENDSVTDLNRDNFIIECMQCVKIDEHEWTEIDDCKNCIFAVTCIKGRQ